MRTYIRILFDYNISPSEIPYKNEKKYAFQAHFHIFFKVFQSLPEQSRQASGKWNANHKKTGAFRLGKTPEYATVS